MSTSPRDYVNLAERLSQSTILSATKKRPPPCLSLAEWGAL